MQVVMGTARKTEQSKGIEMTGCNLDRATRGGLTDELMASRALSAGEKHRTALKWHPWRNTEDQCGWRQKGKELGEEAARPAPHSTCIAHLSGMILPVTQAKYLPGHLYLLHPKPAASPVGFGVRRVCI